MSNLNPADTENDPNEHDSGDESTEDESEVLEESPCGRWQKRREEIKQRDIPGVDIAFLAMDTEEGVEVVWNEVTFSEKKHLKSQQDKIKHVFDNLVDLDHPNLVKFHKYWMDPGEAKKKPRVIFITEYMSSGSLKQFLKKTKEINKTLKMNRSGECKLHVDQQLRSTWDRHHAHSHAHSHDARPAFHRRNAWKRWTTQILSALSYLHSCDPPIIHGNLSCDTIFIQHNGLIKIGSIAPDAIHNHVKTCMNEYTKNMYYVAPEYGAPSCVTTAVDMYSFGICALEMALLDILNNGDTGGVVTMETISRSLDLIDDPLQRDFISKCLEESPTNRPSARELLFHAVLFEVHSLKLLAAHAYNKSADILPETVTEKAYQSKYQANNVIAEIHRPSLKEPFQWKVHQVPTLELDKFLEDVRNGVYPLVAFASIFQVPPARPRAMSPEVAESVKADTPEPVDVETRLVVSMWCAVKKNNSENSFNLTLLLKMDDKMNRQLCCDLLEEESASTLAEELVHHGFINELDKDRIAHLMDDTIRHRPQTDSPSQMLIQQAA